MKFFKSIVKLSSLVTGKSRLFVSFSIFLTLIAAIIEFTGFGLLFNFLSRVLESTPIRNPIPLPITFNTTTNNEGVLLIGLFSFRLIIAMLSTRVSLHGVYLAQQALFNQLFEKLLSLTPQQLYRFGSKESVRLLQADVSAVFHNLLRPIIVSLGEIVNISAIFLMLFFVSPTLAIGGLLTILVILFVGWLLIFPAIRNAGMEAHKEWMELFKRISEAVRAATEIRIYGLEHKFKLTMELILMNYSKALAKYVGREEIPRFISDLIFILIFVALVLRAQSAADQSVLFNMTDLSILGLAIFRLLPSFHRLFSMSSGLAYHWNSISRVLEIQEILEIQNPTTPARTLTRLSFINEIRLENVSFSYSDRLTPVFSNMNAAIKKSQLIAVVGPSGSGKSTLLNLLMGLDRPTNGEIRVDGRAVIELASFWQKELGYASQNPTFFESSLRENLVIEKKSRAHDETIINLMDRLSLRSLLDSLPHGLNTILIEEARDFSAGQRQRLQLIRALLRKPSILILDEPTANLDVDTQILIKNILKELKASTTIIIATHDNDFLSIADQIIRLGNTPKAPA